MLIAKEISFNTPDGRVIIPKGSLSVSTTRSLGLLGPSGCGKTTLLSILSGRLNPSTGHVYFNGKKIIRPGQDLTIEKENIQYVSQNDFLLPYLQVKELFSTKLRNYALDFREREIESIANAFGDRKSVV